MVPSEAGPRSVQRIALHENEGDVRSDGTDKQSIKYCLDISLLQQCYFASKVRTHLKPLYGPIVGQEPVL